MTIFLGLAAAGCAADLWTKQAVFTWRGLPQTREIWWLWPEYVGVQTALNTGAVFGIGGGWTPLFAFLSVLALGFVIFWLFGAGAAHDLWQTVALACVVAGVLGNLYDRLGWWAPADLPPHLPRYAVRDWILLCYGDWVWPNFNVADSLLVVATGLLIWRSIQTEPMERTTDSSTSAADRPVTPSPTSAPAPDRPLSGP